MAEQLWSDERIASAIKEVAHNDLPHMRTQSITAFQAEQLMSRVRDTYEHEIKHYQHLLSGYVRMEDKAALDAANQRIAEGVEANIACGIHIASQMERINRFVELVDQLERRIIELEAQVAWEPVDTVELEWGYQIAGIIEHPDGETTLETTGYSISDPDLQFSIRMPKEYRLCRRVREGGQ